jgi:hypothetical protein
MEQYSCLDITNKELLLLGQNSVCSIICFCITVLKYMLRRTTTHLMTVGELTMIKLKIKFVLTWKGRGPRVPGCGDRFPGLRGAGAGA